MVIHFSTESLTMNSPFTLCIPLILSLMPCLPILFQFLRHKLRECTKPASHLPLLNAAIDFTQTKSELMLENALLRQQLIVLKRNVKPPKLRQRDSGV